MTMKKWVSLLVLIGLGLGCFWLATYGPVWGTSLNHHGSLGLYDKTSKTTYHFDHQATKDAFIRLTKAEPDLRQTQLGQPISETATDKTLTSPRYGGDNGLTLTYRTGNQAVRFGGFFASSTVTVSFPLPPKTYGQIVLKTETVTNSYSLDEKRQDIWASIGTFTSRQEKDSYYDVIYWTED